MTCTSHGITLSLLCPSVRQRCFTYSITFPSGLEYRPTTRNKGLPFTGNAVGCSRTTSVWPKLGLAHRKTYRTKGSRDLQSLFSCLSVRLPCAGSQPSPRIRHLHYSKSRTTPGSKRSMVSLQVPWTSSPKRPLAFTPGTTSRCSKGTWTTASDLGSRSQGKA